MANRTGKGWFVKGRRSANPAGRPKNPVIPPPPPGYAPEPAAADRRTDAELAALEQRMIAAAPIVLEATAEVSDDAEGEQSDNADDEAETVLRR